MAQKLALYDQQIFYDWCKACGICIEFCPKKVYGSDEQGQPVVENPDSCIDCLFCEQHCPELAITITTRHPKRRKSDDR